MTKMSRDAVKAPMVPGELINAEDAINFADSALFDTDDIVNDAYNNARIDGLTLQLEKKNGSVLDLTLPSGETDNTARSAASQAMSLASQADMEATSAGAVASQAQSQATNAVSTATNAGSTAVSAASIANSAASLATNASSEAVNAYSLASTAESDAGKAQSMATMAQSTADAKLSGPTSNGVYQLTHAEGADTWTQAGAGTNLPNAPINAGDYVLDVTAEGVPSWAEMVPGREANVIAENVTGTSYADIASKIATILGQTNPPTSVILTEVYYNNGQYVLATMSHPQPYNANYVYTLIYETVTNRPIGMTVKVSTGTTQFLVYQSDNINNAYVFAYVNNSIADEDYEYLAFNNGQVLNINPTPDNKSLTYTTLDTSASSTPTTHTWTPEVDSNDLHVARGTYQAGASIGTALLNLINATLSTSYTTPQFYAFTANTSAANNNAVNVGYVVENGTSTPETSSFVIEVLYNSITSHIYDVIIYRTNNFNMHYVVMSGNEFAINFLNTTTMQIVNPSQPSSTMNHAVALVQNSIQKVIPGNNSLQLTYLDADGTPHTTVWNPTIALDNTIDTWSNGQITLKSRRDSNAGMFTIEFSDHTNLTNFFLSGVTIQTNRPAGNQLDPATHIEVVKFFNLDGQQAIKNAADVALTITTSIVNNLQNVTITPTTQNVPGLMDETWMADFTSAF
jgi:hypothetical protein